MKGRKPVPTALKVLKGTRSDRINADEPSPTKGTPDPPDWLGVIALDHWREIAPELASAGVLTLADGPALSILCDAYERMRIGETLTERDKGRADYIRLLTEFGLTPASRSKVRVAEKPRDELADFLAG